MKTVNQFQLFKNTLFQSLSSVTDKNQPLYKKQTFSYSIFYAQLKLNFFKLNRRQKYSNNLSDSLKT